jgi:hypothetical protein
MIRTQIYLSEREQRLLRTISARTGKTQSALVREAVDQFIADFDSRHSQTNLMAAFGIWKNRKDIDPQKIRRSWDRTTGAKKT